MPRYTRNKVDSENRVIVANIRYGMECTGIPAKELAAAAGMTLPTLYARFKAPDRFTIKELRRICQKLNMALPTLLGLGDSK